MSLSKARLLSAPVYLAGACLILAVYGFLFPALNWPDEYRNLQLLQQGQESGYAFIYGHFARAVMRLADMLFGLNELGDVLDAVRPGSGFQMIHGALHYHTIAGIPAVYYFAKFANLALAGLFAVVLTLWLCGRGRQPLGKDVRVFLLSLGFPSVAYGIMQISTDILFILCSLLPFFLRGRAAALWFAAVMALLVVEDRSFLLLSAFVLLREIYGALLQRRLAGASPGARLRWLLSCAVLTMAAALLSVRLLADPQWLNMIFPGLGHGVAMALEYTHGKSYNPAVSLVVFYAGMIILPSATEFFVGLLPLYLLLLLVCYRFLVFCLSAEFGEEGIRAYLALLSVLTIFFFLTGVVHVFESGRYYLYLVPYVVHALLSGAVRFKGMEGLKAEWVLLFGSVFFAVTVTLQAYVLGA
ncbi:MAG TPA: hypothetical protein VK149_03105 [Sideroxyarcus sp.]|nr:hypothetical protein [Sideroxyarcus sp.]